mmetsp:Transcript_8592/g.24694  ORF Transcript_8592/g.24694 Transcript_8592/m.24694 type:complete len:305 (+) Transcript_8592:255-1169(+)
MTDMLPAGEGIYDAPPSNGQYASLEDVFRATVEHPSPGGIDAAAAQGDSQPKPGGRRGSAKRKRYTLQEKIDMVSAMQMLKDVDPTIQDAMAAQTLQLGVSQGLLSKWRKHLPELEAQSRSNPDAGTARKKAVPRKGANPQLEDMLRQRAEQRKADGFRVKREWLRQQALDIHAEMCAYAEQRGEPAPPSMNFSNGWVTRFLSRIGWTLADRSGDTMANGDADGSYQPGSRQKSQKQIQFLTAAYELLDQSRLPSAEHCRAIADISKLTVTQVKHWFQNERCKRRRQERTAIEQSGILHHQEYE